MRFATGSTAGGAASADAQAFERLSASSRQLAGLIDAAVATGTLPTWRAVARQIELVDTQRHAICERWLRLITSVASGVRRGSIDWHDWLQTAREIALRCIDRYDWTSGCKFNSYAGRAMVRGLIEQRARHDRRIDAVHLSTISSGRRDGHALDLAVCRDVGAGLIADAEGISELSADELAALCLLHGLRGCPKHTPARSAAILGVTRGELDALVLSARAKIVSRVDTASVA